MCEEGLNDPFQDQVDCARFRAERDMLAQAMERVADDIEQTFLGFEGAEDAPAMRWAREFRAALGSLHAPIRDATMSAHDLKPEWVTHERPAPKVLDADGVEVEIGDDLYTVDGMLKFHVSAIDKRSGRIATEAMFALDKWADPKMYTHHAPVLAADDKPLREGETVWGTGREQHEYVVLGQPGLGGGTGRFKVACHDVTDDFDCDCDPSLLTHERPESKCRDCAHWQKDPTADNMGVCWFFYHEHEGQDCYAARLGDCGACEEFMPRAKALAERG